MSNPKPKFYSSPSQVFVSHLGLACHQAVNQAGHSKGWLETQIRKFLVPAKKHHRMRSYGIAKNAIGLAETYKKNVEDRLRESYKLTEKCQAVLLKKGGRRCLPDPKAFASWLGLNVSFFSVPEELNAEEMTELYIGIFNKYIDKSVRQLSRVMLGHHCEKWWRVRKILDKQWFSRGYVSFRRKLPAYKTYMLSSSDYY